MPDVLFISMPFGPAFTPSIGLSLLQAELARAHIASDIRYFSIPFAERLGSRPVEFIIAKYSLTR